MQNPSLNLTHLTTLRTILGCVNPYVNVFVRATNCLAVNLAEEVHICIIVSRTSGNRDVRCYNVLTVNEVTMIILSDLGKVGNCDVIVQWQYGVGLQQMNELTPSYDPLQYSLFFLVGEDEWSNNLRL
jgi:hypothetical protein